MIAKARAISHGANSMRYVVNKDKADIIKLHLLPDNVSAESLWSRMLLHQAKFSGEYPKAIKNNMIRIEVSPTSEETKGWTNDDWEKLADDFIREFDSIDLSKEAKRAKDRHTNLRNSQYVVLLHRDSKSGILHLHIDANRIDNDGNINNDHNIHIRAMATANNITKRRGWVQASDISMRNRQEITNACMDALRSMDRFDWKDYVERLKQNGYDVMLQKDSKNVVRGYSIKKGNSTYIFRSIPVQRSGAVVSSRKGKNRLFLISVRPQKDVKNGSNQQKLEIIPEHTRSLSKIGSAMGIFPEHIRSLFLSLRSK